MCVKEKSATSAHTHVQHGILTCQSVFGSGTEDVRAYLLSHFRYVFQTNISVITDIGQEGAEMTVFLFDKREKFFLIIDTMFLGGGKETAV